MKRMLNNKLPMVITCWILVIGMILTASPAFSWERNSSQNRDRTYENDRSSDRDRSNNWNGSGDRDRSNNWDGYGNRDRSNNWNAYGNRAGSNNRDGYRDWDRSNVNVKSRNVRVVQVRRTSALPAIIATGIVAGITFSLLDRNNPPAAHVTTPSVCPTAAGLAAPYGAVMVTAALLNIRSGPGLNNPCVGQIHRGARLSIMSTSSGWYYVSTSAGVNGWVMAQFTTPVGAGFSG